MKNCKNKIIRKSLLYKTGVEYGDYTANYVLGCAHGCKYPCYAFCMSKRFGTVKTYDDWINPSIVSNTLQLLGKELPKLKNDIKNVHLCFTTDPFMYEYEDVKQLSLEVIKKINSYGLPCSILTKGILPEELSNYNIYSKENMYGITLVSLDENFKSQYEPNAASLEDRIKALKYLHDRGCKTWVSIEPYPTPNIINQDLLEILNRINFVDKIIFGRLHYNKLVGEYKEHKKYYNDLANIVMEYCKKNKIDYHIKNKTITD